MALPIILPANHVAVYGALATISVNNIQAPDGYFWGSIYMIAPGAEVWVYGGDTVLFKNDQVKCRLAWDNGTYTLLELDKTFIVKEEPPL